MLPLVGFFRRTIRAAGHGRARGKDIASRGAGRSLSNPCRRGRSASGRGSFLPCSFWLADNYWLLGRHDEAQQLFERLTGLANDLGLIAEEYDPKRKRLLGNFPQAFTHVALVNTALKLIAP